MPVFRVNKTKNYTVMSNYHFKEKNMSIGAKGLLSFMLSLPDTWDYSIAGLASLVKEGEKAIHSLLKELKNFGYLKITKIPPSKGGEKTFSYRYNIFEKPQKPDNNNENITENKEILDMSLDPPSVGLPTVDLLSGGQLNTKELNTKKINIYSNNARAREEKTEEKINKKTNELQTQFAIDYVNKYVSDETLRGKIFILFNNRIKKGATPPTIEIAKQIIRHLEEFSDGDYSTKIELLDRSISKGYYSIFRLPEKKQTQVKSNASYDIGQYEKFDQLQELAYGRSRMSECADMSSDIDSDSDTDSDSETPKYNFHSEDDVYKTYPQLKPQQSKEPKEINNNANNESSNESGYDSSQRANNRPLISFNG